MTVVATPITELTPADIADPSSLNVKTADVDTAYDESLYLRKRATKIRQGMTAYISWQLLNDASEPIDLTALGLTEGDSNIKARFRESSLAVMTKYEVTCEITSAADGIVKAYVPEDVADNCGVYLCEFGILDDNDDLLYTNELYLLVEHSAWYDDSTVSNKGVPTVDDIRLSLRDSDPYENELINRLDFGLVEICYAATRVVQFWNDTPPYLPGAKYSTKTFPYRDIWLTGIHLYLFEMAEEHYRRNRLPYSAGGVSTDDKGKSAEYGGAWQVRFQRFRAMVMHQKAAINMRRAYGAFGSF